jgi:hypothetical protein
VEKDYEDIRDIDHLTDNELRAMVRDEFEAQLAFDPDDVDVSVASGVVRLSGRVGTDEELRIVERVATDVVGIERLKSELVVDSMRRAESPEAIDEHLVDERLHEGLLLGDSPRPEDPEAEHLHENIRAELFGTTDVQQAIEGAIPWNPPDGPTPEGIEGSEDTPSELRDEI